MATLPGGSKNTFNPAFKMFLPHAYTFVTGSTSSFNFDQSTGLVTTTYVLQTKVMQKEPGTDTGALQALNATQYNNLSAGEMRALKGFNVNGKYNYVSPHGELLLWDGPVFSTQLQYTGILPSVPPMAAGVINAQATHTAATTLGSNTIMVAVPNSSTFDFGINWTVTGAAAIDQQAIPASTITSISVVDATHVMVTLSNSATATSPGSIWF